MTRLTLGGWRGALRWIAAGVLWTQVATGQGTAPDAGEPGECMPSREPHECAERCPSFDTCYIDEGDGQIYYRVMNQRFECTGLDCNAASVQLGDYCCQRGDYAPSRGGGGCALPPPETSGPLERSSTWGVGLGALFALVAAGRARRHVRARCGVGSR